VPDVIGPLQSVVTTVSGCAPAQNPNFRDEINQLDSVHDHTCSALISGFSNNSLKYSISSRNSGFHDLSF
jgi:hypothetical protein